jgi:hypothetical protein
MLASKGTPETSAIFSSKGKAWFCCLVKVVLISTCSARTNKVLKELSMSSSTINKFKNLHMFWFVC